MHVYTYISECPPPPHGGMVRGESIFILNLPSRRNGSTEWTGPYTWPNADAKPIADMMDRPTVKMPAKET